MALLAAIRIGVLALVGAMAGLLGTALQVPRGIALVLAMYLLYTTVH